MRKASRQPNEQREQSQVNLNSAESRMRKPSRQMPAEWALEVFDKAPYITVSMCEADGMPFVRILMMDCSLIEQYGIHFNDSVAGIKEAIQRPYRL